MDILKYVCAIAGLVCGALGIVGATRGDTVSALVGVGMMLVVAVVLVLKRKGVTISKK